MALDSNSYLTEFFDEDRLAHLRSLSQDFPLWCGIWPPFESSLPEHNLWALEPRLRREAPGNLVVFHEDLTQSISDGPKVIGTIDATWVEAEVPPTEAVLLTAINYTLRDWRSDGETFHPIDTLQSWANALTRIIRRTTPRNVAFLWDEGVEPELSGDLLLHLRGAAIAEERGGDGARKEALAALEDLWIRIGEVVGILPIKGPGGAPQTLLPDDFLRRLIDELRGADGLLYRVIRYRPTEADMIFARALGLGPDERPHWLRQLMFPMLTARELGDVMKETRGFDSEKKKKLSLDMLSGRLPISRGTLKNLL